MQVLIIGNGIAGITVAQEIRKDHKETDLEIKIFTHEVFTHYNRPKLPSFIGNPKITALDVIGPYDPIWYEKKDIELHLNERVTSVNLEDKEIITETSTYKYDKLVLATGASCARPKMKGTDLKNFFTLRTLQDALDIKEGIGESKKAILMGGGILGLEIGANLQKTGIEVTVIESNPYLLHRQLDEEGSQILQKILEDTGMKFILSNVVSEAVGVDGQLKCIVLRDGEEKDTDLVIACIGVRSNIELVEDVGLEVNRGIIVNDYLETSKGEDVYAIGDCAEHAGRRPYGLWFPCIEQARIAADNIISAKSAKYTGSKISTSLKVAGIILTSIRFSGKEEERGYEVKKHVDVDKNEYVKLYINENKIQSALIIGMMKAISIIKKIAVNDLSFKENFEKIKTVVPNLGSAKEGFINRY